MEKELIEAVKNFDSPQVLLMGDFMIDRYVYGNADRLSPEAPVPILCEVRRTTQTGGAGNVAAGILALGGKVMCVGVIGSDSDADELIRLLVANGADTSRLIKDPDRSTTVKTRYVGLAQHRHAQQLLRVDRESSAPINSNIMVTLKAAIRGELHSCEVLAIEDYDKGLFDKTNTPELISLARQAGCKVVVDPACINDYRRYRGAALLTPNRYEAERASGIEITDDESLKRAAGQILLITEADAVVITLDKQGAFIMEKNSTSRMIPTRPRSVYDVSGAGDEVLAMLAVAVANDCDLARAVMLANIVGGLEVEKFGMVPITRQEVIEELSTH